ncbi:hypothetical protein [Caldalkalibacillus salinus]|uniref:hypothetical protein n=1 Tax=Caldalkalibacillus salinus TaxID=2803787 RepID=UPI001922E148|nr:hypothetical protein [Caldalkalibacillus salinus]
MKFKKSTLTVLSFTVGACMFVSTAFADMALGTGYDRLKHTVKGTAAQMEEDLDNYTIEMLVTLKDNDQTLFESSIYHKIDNENQASEETSVTQYSNGETTRHYRYYDQEMSVWKNNTDDRYYVTEYDDDFDRGNRKNIFTNPFNEDGAAEMEKIADAVVGNLKDYVQFEDTPDGGRAYSGHLSEAQVPALINAVSSFGVKQMINDQRHMERNRNLPEITSDIFVKNVTGTAIENEAGLLENLTGQVVLSGQDDSGAQHELSLDVVFKLSDIGNTTFTAPDLTSEDVERVSHDSFGFNSKHVGTYKNDIVIEKDGAFVKIGERTLEITSVEDKTVTGKYYETVKPEYESDYPQTPYDFTFEYVQESEHMSFFTYQNANGEEEQGSLHPSDKGQVYLDLGIEVTGENSYHSGMNHEYFNGQFNRVFEE